MLVPPMTAPTAPAVSTEPITMIAIDGELNRWARPLRFAEGIDSVGGLMSFITRPRSKRRPTMMG